MLPTTSRWVLVWAGAWLILAALVLVAATSYMTSIGIGALALAWMGGVVSQILFGYAIRRRDVRRLRELLDRQA